MSHRKLYPMTSSIRFICLTACLILQIGVNCAKGQLSADAMKTLSELQKNGGDPHDVSLALSSIERRLREGSEDAKLSGSIQAVDLAVLIYRTHDTSVPVDQNLSRHPDFDATKSGEKPLMLVADPVTYFKNPKTIEAYNQALASHKKLLSLVSKEKHKFAEGDYCAEVAFRVIQTSQNQTELKNKIRDHIESIKDALWIKKRLMQLALPDLPVGQHAMMQGNLLSQNAIDQPRSSVGSDAPVIDGKPAVSTTSSNVSVKSDQTFLVAFGPWIFCAVVLIAIVVVWAKVKKSS